MLTAPRNFSGSSFFKQCLFKNLFPWSVSHRPERLPPFAPVVKTSAGGGTDAPAGSSVFYINPTLAQKILQNLRQKFIRFKIYLEYFLMGFKRLW